MKYWSKEWTEAIKEASHTDKDYLSKTKGWDVKALWVVTGCPEGVDKCMEFHLESGKVVFISLEEKPSPSDLATLPWDASKYFVRVIAPYDIFAKINTKEWSALRAISSGLLVIEGRADELIQRISQFACFCSELLPRIPVEY